MSKNSCAAITLLLTTSLTQPVAAFVDPLTASAAISLVSQGFALGAKSDPQAKEISAILEHVRSLSDRLTKVEDGIFDIQKMIDRLPERWRQDMKSLVDEIRRENFSGASTVLRETANALASVPRGDRKQRRDYESRVRHALLEFKQHSRTLEKRSGAVAPYMIAAMVQELAIERQLNIHRQAILDILGFYDKYFADMLDENVSGSLAQTRLKFERDRTSDRDKLSQLLSKSKDAPFAGEFPFYSVTKTVPTRREILPARREDCRFTRPDSMIAGCRPAEPAKYTVDFVPTATYRHVWQIKSTPLKGPSGLELLDVKEFTHEEKPDASERTNDVAIIDKRNSGTRTEILSLRDTLNISDRAIALLREQETSVAMARTLIANWNSGDAEALASLATALMSSDISNMKTNVDDVRSSLQVDKRKNDMIKSRNIATALVERAEARLQEALVQAKKDRWRRELMHGMAIAQLGLQTYHFVNAQTQKANNSVSPENKPNRSNKHSSQQQQSSTKTNGTDQRIRTQVNSDKTVRKFTDAARSYLQSVKAMPADSWPELTGSVTRSEAMIDLGLASLQQADQTAVVLKTQATTAEKSSEANLLLRGADLVIKGKYTQALATALMPAATVSADEDSPYGFSARNSVREELLALKADFVAKRAAQSLSDHAPEKP